MRTDPDVSGSHPVSDGGARLRRRLLWWLALGVAAAAAVRLVDVVDTQLAAPFDVHWETPTLRTAELLAAGRDPYSPEVYAAPPFWLTPYTPLYPALIAVLPGDAANPFRTGRLISLLCLLLSAGAFFVVARRAGVPLALLATGAFFLVRATVSGAAHLKSDPMALALSAGVLLLAARAGRASRPGARSAWLLAAAAAGAAAFFAKQNFVAAPAAVLLWLLLVDRRRAVLFAGLQVLCVALPLALLWSDGFSFSVFRALRNPISSAHFALQWRHMLVQPAFVAVGGWCLAALALCIVRRRVAPFLRSPFALYALCATAVLLLTVGKLGSSLNYFTEPVLACLLALVDAGRARLASREVGASAGAVPMPVLAGTLLVAAAALELGLEPGDRPARFVTRDVVAERSAQLQGVGDAIRALGRDDPLLLNLYDTRMSFPLPGTVCVNDPLLYYLLYEAGSLSTDVVVAELRARRFDGVLSHPGILTSPAPPPMRALHAALVEHYRPGLDFGIMEVLVPKDPP
jgi:hypothetical protein